MTQRLHLLISIKNYSWADIHLFWPGYDGLAYFPASGPVTCHLSLALAAPAPFISSWRLPHHTILDLCPAPSPPHWDGKSHFISLSTYWLIRSLSTDQASSVNRFSREGARIEKKKAIRQHCNMTPATSEAEGRFIFSSLPLYHSKDIKRIWPILRHKQST